MEEKRYAVVVGAVNMDVHGKPHQRLVRHDSNPGRVTMSLGGVGRNIAHNMSLLGVPTNFITALGDDSLAHRVEYSCESLGLDLRGTIKVPGGSTSTYLYISNEEGEMEVAVSDMAIYDALTPAFLETQLPLLGGAAVVVADTNIPAQSLAFLAQNCKAPLFVDPVSTAKAEKVRPILGQLHTLKPNKLEAQLLTGLEIHDQASLQAAARALLDTGLRRVFISLGKEGVLCADHQKLCHLPCFPGPVTDTNGCGDAFTAALAWAHFQGLDLESAGRAGLAAGAIALAGLETINPKLSAFEVCKLAAIPMKN